MGEKEGKSTWKHYSHVLSYQDIRIPDIRRDCVGDRASEYWEWGVLGGKCWLRFTIEIDFSQMPIHKYVWKYIKTWIYC